MIRVIVGDIASTPADAVVRAATTNLGPAAALARRLDQLRDEATPPDPSIRDRLDPGAAVVTSGDGLSTDLIVHTVIKADADAVTATGLRRALRSALERAVQFDVRHLLIPPIGAEPGELDPTVAANAVAETLLAHMRGAPFPEEVTVVVETEDARVLFETAIRDAESMQ